MPPASTLTGEGTVVPAAPATPQQSGATAAAPAPAVPGPASSGTAPRTGRPRPEPQPTGAPSPRARAGNRPAASGAGSSPVGSGSDPAAPAAAPEPGPTRLYDALIASGGSGRQLLAARGLSATARGMRQMNVALPVDLADAIDAATSRDANPKRDLVVALLYAYCEDMGVAIGG